MLSIFLSASDVFGGKPRLVVVLLLLLETSCGRLSLGSPEQLCLEQRVFFITPQEAVSASVSFCIPTMYCLDLDALTGRDISRDSKQKGSAAFLAGAQLPAVPVGLGRRDRDGHLSAPWRGRCTRDLGP